MEGIISARTFLLTFDWIIALSWLLRISHWLRGLTRVPNLLRLPLDNQPASKLTVIVPARNEEKAINACLQSLLASTGIDLEIIAVDDRSTDSTSTIMDRLVATTGNARLRVIHIHELPTGWMGKTHAMALAAAEATGKWLVFTDGDCLFDPNALRLALQYAEAEEADHVILYPTLIYKTFGERMMLSFLHVISIWGPRPWKVSDPKAKRDYIGIGAFNLIRRSTYDAIGGWSALRMEVLEDLRIGFIIKRSDFRQRAVFGRDLIRIRWAEGALGIVNNMTKNLFAVFRFRLLIACLACTAVFLLCLAPFLTPAIGPSALSPLIVILVALAVLYGRFHKLGLPQSAYALTFPIGAIFFLFALARSIIETIARQGVRWRGTFYPLAELRRNAGPLR